MAGRTVAALGWVLASAAGVRVNGARRLGLERAGARFGEELDPPRSRDSGAPRETVADSLGLVADRRLVARTRNLDLRMRRYRTRSAGASTPRRVQARPGAPAAPGARRIIGASHFIPTDRR